MRDVVRRKNIRNTIFLEQLINFLADNVGNLFSSKSISDFLKHQKVDISPRARRLENLVCNHLLFCGYNVKIGTITTEEIDFVCTRNGETLYVQVVIELSRQETINREFGNLLKIKDNYPKIVVSGEQSFESTHEGIEHIYIKDFLSSTLSHTIL